MKEAILPAVTIQHYNMTTMTRQKYSPYCLSELLRIYVASSSGWLAPWPVSRWK